MPSRRRNGLQSDVDEEEEARQESGGGESLKFLIPRYLLNN